MKKKVQQALETQYCKILDVSISRMGFDDALEWANQKVLSHQGGAVYFANVHTVTESTWNTPLKKAMDRSMNFADGMPLVWVSKKRGQEIKSRVCGPDFMKSFLESHRDLPQAFIGGKEEQMIHVSKKYQLQHAKIYSPPFRPFSAENVSDDLKTFLLKNSLSELPPVLWIGLGAPKQELWIQEASKIYPQTLFFGVGAAFDFLSGTKKRAPVWMQKLGLEWFFRLVTEPRRLWKRYFTTNILFIYKVIFQKN